MSRSLPMEKRRPHGTPRTKPTENTLKSLKENAVPMQLPRCKAPTENARKNTMR